MYKKRHITLCVYKLFILFLSLTSLLLFQVLYFRANSYYIQIDFDYATIYTEANFTNLNLSLHVSKLISNNRCNTEHIKLLILITSNVSGFYRRETIRMTWGKRLQAHVNEDFRTFFVVARSKDEETTLKIKEESELHKDIIFTNYYENFYNLSFKVESAFEWAYKHCSFDYLLKGDDDVFVNIFQVFDLLYREQTPKNKLYVGMMHHRAIVERQGRYSVSFQEYGTRHYPNYCGGGAVAFSADVIKSMIPYYQEAPLIIDDVYIGMLCMNAGIRPIKDEYFRLAENSCTYENKTIAHHPAKQRSCMQTLFYNMLLQNLENIFVRTHYIEQAKDLGS